MKRIALLASLLVAAHGVAQTPYGRLEFQLQNAQGQAISGATVFVYNQTACGTPATISTGNQAALYPTANGGTLITQPVRTNGFGQGAAYAAQGCYTVVYNSPYTGTITVPDQNSFAASQIVCSGASCDPGITNGVPNFFPCATGVNAPSWCNLTITCADIANPAWCSGSPTSPAQATVWLANAIKQLPLQTLGDGTSTAHAGEVDFGPMTWLHIGQPPTAANPSGSPLVLNNNVTLDCKGGGFIVDGPYGIVDAWTGNGNNPSNVIRHKIKNCTMYAGSYVPPSTNIVSEQTYPFAYNGHAANTVDWTVGSTTGFVLNSRVFCEGCVNGLILGYATNHNPSQVLSIADSTHMTTLTLGQNTAPWIETATPTAPIIVSNASAGNTQYCESVSLGNVTNWPGQKAVLTGFTNSANNSTSTGFTVVSAALNCFTVNNPSGVFEDNTTGAMANVVPPLITDAITYTGTVGTPWVVSAPDANGNQTYTGPNINEAYAGFSTDGKQVILSGFHNAQNNVTADISGALSGPAGKSLIVVYNPSGVAESGQTEDQSATAVVKLAMMKGDSAFFFPGGDVLGVLSASTAYAPQWTLDNFTSDFLTVAGVKQSMHSVIELGGNNSYIAGASHFHMNGADTAVLFDPFAGQTGGRVNTGENFTFSDGDFGSAGIACIFADGKAEFHLFGVSEDYCIHTTHGWKPGNGHVIYGFSPNITQDGGHWESNTPTWYTEWGSSFGFLHSSHVIYTSNDQNITIPAMFTLRGTRDFIKIGGQYRSDVTQFVTSWTDSPVGIVANFNHDEIYTLGANVANLPTQERFTAGNSFNSISGIITTTLYFQASVGDVLNINPYPGYTTATGLTIVASGATGNQVNIGADATGTMANIVTVANASTDANLSQNTYSSNGPTLTITPKTPGMLESVTVTAPNAQWVVSGAIFSQPVRAETLNVVSLQPGAIRNMRPTGMLNFAAIQPVMNTGQIATPACFGRDLNTNNAVCTHFNYAADRGAANYLGFAMQGTGGSVAGAEPDSLRFASGSHVQLPQLTSAAGLGTDSSGNIIATSGTGTTTNPLTANSSGGAAPGTTFDGSVARTFDYHSFGAAGVSGTPTPGNCTDWASSTTIGDAGTPCGAAGSGVQYNPVTTAYAIAGASTNADDAHTTSTGVTAGAWSCAAGICTVNTTGAHGLVAGDFVDCSHLTSWPAAPSGLNTYDTGYGTGPVLTAATTTQFTFAYIGGGTPSGTGGTIYNANFYGVYASARQPFLNGHGTMYYRFGSLFDLHANFATNFSGITGTPKYLIINGGQNDISGAGSVAAAVVSVEASLQSLWADAHSAGWTVIQTPILPTAYGFSTCNSGTPDICTLATMQINGWLLTKAKQFSALSGGSYYDFLLDGDQIDWYDSGTPILGVGATGGTLFASMVNQAFAGQGGNQDLLSTWFSTQQSKRLLAYGGSLHSGFDFASLGGTVQFSTGDGGTVAKTLNISSLAGGGAQCATISNTGDVGAGACGGSTTNALTINNSGTGDASGSTFNGSAAKTISYNSIGAAGLAASNTFTGATTNDFSGTSQFKLPVAAGYASLANGEVGYDSTNKNWHLWKNGADSLLIPFPASPTSGDCYAPTSSGGVWSMVDAGGPCGISGGGVTSWSGDGALFNNSGSTGVVTGALANAAAHKFWGNNTGSSAAPGYQTVGPADMTAQATNTVVMNATGGSAAPTAVAMPTCTTGADLYNTSTHAWSCVSTGSGGFSPFPATQTTPLAANFTTTNFSGQTVADKTGRMVATIVGSTTTMPGLISNTVLPATPYTIDIAGTYSSPIQSSSAFLALTLRNSSSGKLVAFEMRLTQSTLIPQFVGEQWTNFTTFSATDFTVVSVPVNMGYFALRITDDGTTRKFLYSNNGQDYFQLASEADTTFMTADTAAISFLNGTGSGQSINFSIYNYAVTGSVLPNVGP